MVRSPGRHGGCVPEHAQSLTNLVGVGVEVDKRAQVEIHLDMASHSGTARLRDCQALNWSILQGRVQTAGGEAYSESWSNALPIAHTKDILCMYYQALTKWHAD